LLFSSVGESDSADPLMLISHSMNDKKYNGWSNYETWVTNLWLTNDENTYAQCREIAEAAFAGARSSATLTRIAR
jgi:hypothetical protein